MNIKLVIFPITLIVVFVLICTSCNQNKGVKNTNIKNSPEVTIKRDTAFTAIVYSFDWNSNDHRISTAKRIIKDTILPDPQDITRNIKTSDTSYLIPLFSNVLDSISNKPRLDSTGKPITRLNWFILPKSLLLIDYNKDFKLKQ